MFAPLSDTVPPPSLVKLPAPEMTPESVPVPPALATLSVSDPELASAPTPEMPPVPFAISVRPLETPELVIPALRTTPPAAVSVSVVLAVQLTGLATVMLPVSLPLEPVVTLTLAVASAFCSVVVLIVAPVAMAVKPVAFAFAPVEIVTL